MRCRRLLRLLPPRVSSAAAASPYLAAPPAALAVPTATTAAPSTPPKGSGTDAVGVEGTAGRAQPGECTIDSVFNVPGVGVVVAGTVVRGSIRSGSTMLLGPDRLGEFQPVIIRSIHVHYTPVNTALPGGSAAFAIRLKGKNKTAAGGGAASDRKAKW